MRRNARSIFCAVVVSAVIASKGARRAISVMPVGRSTSRRHAEAARLTASRLGLSLLTPPAVPPPDPPRGSSCDDLSPRQIRVRERDPRRCCRSTSRGAGLPSTPKNPGCGFTHAWPHRLDVLTSVTKPDAPSDSPRALRSKVSRSTTTSTQRSGRLKQATRGVRGPWTDQRSELLSPFRTRRIVRTVFQFRVVTGTPNSASSCPR